MSKSKKNEDPGSKALKRKVFLLTFLITILLAISVAAYTSQQYEKGLEESLYLLEETDKEEIEFNVEDIPEDYIHVLLVGIDNEGGGPARTDTMMIAQYQPKNGKAKLISLMRDSYVTIPGYRNNKINTAFFLGGPELLRQTIKENFDIDIHYYALIDFNGFERVVDIVAPKGIEVDIERRMFYQDSYGGVNIDFKPGLQRLDGKEALNYVRFRSDAENDFGRVRRQQEVLSILKDELLSVSGITRLPRLIGSVQPYIQTNVETREIISYGKAFFINPINEIETLTIPVQDSYTDKGYNHAGAVLELDIEQNRQAMHDFLELNGPTEIELEDETAEEE